MFFPESQTWTTTPELDRLQASPVNLQFYCWKYVCIVQEARQLHVRHQQVRGRQARRRVGAMFRWCSVMFSLKVRMRQ